MTKKYWHNVDVPFPDATYEKSNELIDDPKEYAIITAKLIINLNCCWKNMVVDANGKVYDFFKQKETIAEAMVTLRVLEAISVCQADEIYAELQT